MDPTEAITFLHRTDYLLFRLGDLLAASTDDPEVLTEDQINMILTTTANLSQLETELNLTPIMPPPPE